MNALGAFVGAAAESALRIQCAGLFAGSDSPRLISAEGAVLGHDAPHRHAGAVSCAQWPGGMVVADARIDARAELGGALGLDPSDIRRLSPAELIARSWERWGAACLERLVGDYAFLVWETGSRKLSLVRDFNGSRPLHYAAMGAGLAAASLPSVIAEAKGRPQVDLLTLARYHAMLPQTGPESFFEGVQRVEPGTLVEWQDGRTSARRYWTPPRDRLRIGKEEAAEQVWAILGQAVRDRTVGADGVALHLSGGMDSSAVAAAVGSLGMPALAITGETASRGDQPPPGFVGSEAATAAATAALYPSLRHAVARADERPIIALMGDWNGALDQPLRSIENGAWLDATYREAAGAGATTLLTGEFGNNSFSYDGIALLGELLRWGRWLRLLREGRGYARHHGARWTGVAAYALGKMIPVPIWRRYLGQPPLSEGLEQATLFRRGHPILDAIQARANSDGHDLTERPGASAWTVRAHEIGAVDNALYHYEVRRRWNLQLADPTADRRLVEFTLHLPGEHWMEQGRTRALARRVLKGRVAPAVIDPPGRGYQGSGWRAAVECCLPELRAEAARLRGTPWGEALDLERISDLLEHWPTDGWSDYRQVYRYRATLLTAISFGHFARIRSA